MNLRLIFDYFKVIDFVEINISFMVRLVLIIFIIINMKVIDFIFVLVNVSF